MSKLIEVEIENKSYIKLLDLEQQSTNKLKLTTLKDNQTAVIIKVFLNKSDTRIPIKEFTIRNLNPKISGLPRFELFSSYNNKVLNLELKVDGRKGENAEIKLAKYFRNKFLPLYILLGLLAIFLLFSGGKWLIRSFAENTNNIQTPAITEQQPSNEKEIVEKNISTPEITKIEPEPTLSKKTETAKEPIAEPVNSIFIAYFTPNNTGIQEEAAQKLKNIAKDLQEMPKAIVEISGYCANTGTEEGRERLSKERAYNVLAYIKNEGWVPETEPIVRWYGGLRPVTSKEEEIYKNRRVEISIVSQ